MDKKQISLFVRLLQKEIKSKEIKSKELNKEHAQLLKRLDEIQACDQELDNELGELESQLMKASRELKELEK